MNKQIEELMKEIHLNCPCGLFEDEAAIIAKFVIEEQGYRRQEDIVREIMNDIDKILGMLMNDYTTFNRFSEAGTVLYATYYLLDELKKKYGVQDDTK